ncbi:MAG: GNAT family N-acetyltransferase [Chloroflexia bacterium]
MVVAIKEYTSEDAAALSQMFYASDLAWPDGFDDGVLYSPEALIEEDRDRKWLNAFLAWADDKVVGYVDMMSIPNDDKAAYVGLLNSPDYHGRGVGRDLLLRVIERCVELKLNRVTLGTWMGNSNGAAL